MHAENLTKVLNNLTIGLLVELPNLVIYDDGQLALPIGISR